MTLTEFLEKEKHLMESATPVYDHRIPIYYRPGDLLEGSPAYNFVKTVSKNNYDELRTSHAKALEIIEVLEEGIFQALSKRGVMADDDFISSLPIAEELNEALARAEEILK